MIYSKIFFIMCLATNALGASSKSGKEKPFAKGGQGEIYKRKHNGVICAEKEISSATPEANGMEQLKREDVMAGIIEKHRANPPHAENAGDWKYIPQLFDTIDKSEAEGKIILCYEFIEGTCPEVKDTFPFEDRDELTMLTYLQQIAMALRALHSVRILHNDIKPGNIMFDDKNRRAVLIDFGISMEIPKNEDSLTVLQRAGGSTKYLPNFTMMEKMNRSFKGEVFALGRVFMEAFNLSRYEPYKPRRRSNRIAHRWVLKDVDGRISEKTQKFMQSMTHRDRAVRPSISEVVEFCEGQMRSLQPVEAVSSPPSLSYSDTDTDMSIMDEKVAEPEPVCRRGPFPVGSRITITDREMSGPTTFRADGSVQEIKTAFWDTRRKGHHDGRTLYAGSSGRVVEVCRNGDVVVEWDEINTKHAQHQMKSSSYHMEWVSPNRSRFAANLPFKGCLVKQ